MPFSIPTSSHGGCLFLLPRAAKWPRSRFPKTRAQEIRVGYREIGFGDGSFFGAKWY